MTKPGYASCREALPKGSNTAMFIGSSDNVCHRELGAPITDSTPQRKTLLIGKGPDRPVFPKRDVASTEHQHFQQVDDQDHLTFFVADSTQETTSYLSSLRAALGIPLPLMLPV